MVAFGNKKELFLKLSFLVAFLSAGITNGVTIDDGSICSNEGEDDSCPAEMTEIYRDIGKFKMCCETGTNAEKNQKAKAVRCRSTKCAGAGSESNAGGDVCSSSRFLTPRVVNGRKLQYESLMEERCSNSLEGGNGVATLCCPIDSTNSYLATTFGAEPNEFPHMAMLTTPSQCAGTVYNKRFIITAAHCVVDDFDGIVKSPDEVTVTLASSSVANAGKERFVFKVKRVIPHQNYSKLRGNTEGKGYIQYNDIALLELARDIQFGDSVKALEIAPKGFQPREYEDKAIVLGWGRNPKNYHWTHLQKSNFLIRNESACFDLFVGYYWTMGEKKNQLLCLGGIVNGSWSPVVGRGDAGGPAVCRGQGGYPVLCGLTSFGPPHQKCLDDENESNCPPSAFVDVGYFHDWIKKTAGEQEARTLYKPYLYGRQVAKVLYEHQVHINSDTGKSCSGTLIRPDAVLTAAHCIFQGDSYSFGDMHNGIRVSTSRGKRFRVEVAEHLPDFRRLWPRLNIDLAHNAFANTDHHKLAVDYYHKNDLALIKLTGREDIDQKELPQIPKANELYTFAKEVSYSRERNTTVGRGDNNFMERDFKILGETDCDKRLQRLSNAGMRVDFGEGVLCGVEVYSGGSICDRELGGGLLCQKGGKSIICGVQAFRLCERSYPNIFVDVGFQRHRKWIQDTLKKWYN